MKEFKTETISEKVDLANEQVVLYLRKGMHFFFQQALFNT